MEIIQEIGSYAGFAAVIGLAVLSALYFSQARDVKRLREWAGRAPERATAPAPPASQPQRVVAQPIARPAPGQPGPVVPRPPGPLPATPAAAPAQAASTGAAPVVSGPGPATPAAGAPPPPDADQDESGTGQTEPGAEQGPAADDAERGPASTDQADGADSEAPASDTGSTSQDTVVADPVEPPDADGGNGAAGPSGEGDDFPDTGEWTPEDEHSELGEFTDEQDALPAATPLPPRPPQPFPRRGGAVPAGRQGRGAILPPYAESRPQGDAGPAKATKRRRPVLLALAGVLALAVAVFAVLQVTGGDDAGSGGIAATSSGDGQGSSGKVDPSSVTVAVLNGTVQPGLAAQIGDQIANEGYMRGVVTNNSDQERAESVVLYAPGAEREAIDVSRRLDIPQREPIDAASQSLAGDATVVVIAGSDQIR
jgi:LytR cell envelope-related transcriptional attenuator